MIRDRGRIKWTSLMLPEHVKMLREWAREDEWEEEAELDEQRLEELDRLIQKAFLEKKQVRIFYKERSITGTIEKIDPVRRLINIRTENRSREEIPVLCIEDAEII